MAVFLVGLLFFLSLASYSDANYCVCNSGLSDSVLQKNIDYACGNGADCSQILQSGPCFNPNTVKDHCNYAVNSYYQRRANMGGSCDFSSTATLVPNPPATSPGCVYPSSASNAGGSTTPSTGGTPTTGGTPVTPAPPMTPTVGGTFPGGTTTPGSPTTPGFGMGPTGSGLGNPDGSNAGAELLSRSSSFVLVSIAGLVWVMMM